MSTRSRSLAPPEHGLYDAASTVIGGRAEQQIAFAPNRGTDVEAVVGFVRMTPKQLAVTRIEPHDGLGSKNDQLILAIDVDHDGRCRRQLEILSLPPDDTGYLIESDDGATGSPTGRITLSPQAIGLEAYPR